MAHLRDVQRSQCVNVQLILLYHIIQRAYCSIVILRVFHSLPTFLCFVWNRTANDPVIAALRAVATGGGSSEVSSNPVVHPMGQEESILHLM